jgi:hypothetical protein
MDSLSISSGHTANDHLTAPLAGDGERILADARSQSLDALQVSHGILRRSTSNVFWQIFVTGKPY